MFRAVRRSSSGAPTVFAASGLHAHVVTGRSQVWVGTLQIQLELLMMSDIPLETCWAFNELWNNKFRYQVASCWLLLLSHTTMHGSMNIKYCIALRVSTYSSNRFVPLRFRKASYKKCLHLFFFTLVCNLPVQSALFRYRSQLCWRKGCNLMIWYDTFNCNWVATRWQ